MTNKDKIITVLLFAVVGSLTFVLGYEANSGRKDRLVALEECLSYASTYDVEKGAEIRDLCIHVYVGGPK
jgi:hypothetical protein